MLALQECPVDSTVPAVFVLALFATLNLIRLRAHERPSTEEVSR